MGISPSEIKDIIIEEVRGLLADPMRQIAGSEDLTRDLRIASDDLSFLFVPMVRQRFGVTPTNSEWAQVNSIDDTVALVMKYLQRR